MTSALYTNAKYMMVTDTLLWTSPAAVFRAMLVGAGYTYNAAHTVVSDVIGQEVSGGTYGRVTVSSRTAVRDLSGDSAQGRAANVSFPGLTGVTPSGCIIYRRGGATDETPNDDVLVCFVDFPETGTDATDFVVEFSATGVFALGSGIDFLETVFGELIIVGIGP